MLSSIFNIMHDMFCDKIPVIGLTLLVIVVNRVLKSFMFVRFIMY